MTRAQYLELNDRLADVLFDDQQSGRPVYVGADESALSRAVEGMDTGGRGPLRLLQECTRATLHLEDAGVAPFRWYVDRLRARANPLETPPTIALLTLLAIAADQMASGDGMAANNYYGRLDQLLDVPEERRDRVHTDYQKVAEDLWGSLNDWLVAWEGTRGLPTAYAVGHRHVGLPMSQALVREHDRTQLTRIFRAEGLPPGLQMTLPDMEDVLSGWVSRTPSPLSNAFRLLFANPAARERMLSVACLELEAWDGATFGDGELKQAAVRSFGDLRLVATMRTFLGRALELNLLVPLVDGVAVPLNVAAGGTTVPLDVRPAAGGTGRLARVDLLDLDSLLVDQVDGTLGVDGRSVERRPRRVVPLRWQELQSAYVEVERVERGDRVVLLALQDTEKRLLEFLEVAARPGYTVHESMTGLPSGWILVTDVQVMAAVEGTYHRDFVPLVPRAQTSLAFSGGLSLPGNLRKWSRDAPPELNAVAAGAERIKVRVDQGSRLGDVLDEMEFEGESAIIDLRKLELEDGEYLFTLYVAGARKPCSSAQLRLRSADVPVSAEAVDGGRLVYDSVSGPAWPISAGERESGQCVDGVVLDGGLQPVDTGVVTPAPEYQQRPQPTREAPSLPRLRVGRQLGDDSCMHTGAHRFELPPAKAGRPSAASVEGECTTCGIVKRFPTTPWAAKKRDRGPVRRLHVHQVASDLPPVRADSDDYSMLMLDAISHVGSGNLSSLARIGSITEASAVFTDTLARDLEAVGHVDLRRDEMNNIVEWGVNFPTLVPVGQRWYLSGRTSQSLVRAMRDAAPGGRVDVETDLHVATVWMSDVDPTKGRLAEVLHERGVTVLESNPALSLARALPAISSLVESMPRRSLPASKRLERWHTGSARWVETETMMSPGAYRITNFSRTYCVRDEQDVADGTIRIGGVQLVKHVASAWAGDALPGYHTRTESLLVPKGADLPGLYARAAVVASGRVARSTSSVLQYRDVPRQVADVLFSKLSS